MIKNKELLKNIVDRAKEHNIKQALKKYEKFAKETNFDDDKIKTLRNLDSDYHIIDSADKLMFKTSILSKKLSDSFLDENIFNKIQSNEKIEEIFPIYPATNSYIYSEGAGIGKTSFLMYYLSKIQDFNPHLSILVIQSEMSEIDLKTYEKRISSIGNLEIIYFNEIYENHLETLQDIFNIGYDIILIDSINTLVDVISNNQNIPRNKVETEIKIAMRENNKGVNETKKHTSFIFIGQTNKDGTFKGSSSWEHDVSSMGYMSNSSDSEWKYLVFPNKNRRGEINKRLYFKFVNNNNGIEFKNEQEYKNDLDFNINFDIL